MESFGGRIAVVTGGGTGMGRELVIQLAADGCSVAMCDVNAESMAETKRRAEDGAPAGVKITTHVCDVSDEAQVLRFRDEMRNHQDVDHVHLVFNNAGIGGGASFVAGDRDEWERTFGVCWGGVYNVSRAFVPLLVAADEGVLVNTSSVNGFWASLGPGIPHTAYATAKFAVKGFSEALQEDFRVNAPHVKVAVVMPGHIGTDIVANSGAVHGEDLKRLRADLTRRGMDVSEATDDDLRTMMRTMAEAFRDNAPVTAAEAATVILDSVRAGRWRILIGDDARALDERVRADPESVYGPDGIALGTVTGR
jgi:NAD(P)-dependent dehydrogenase (short-subunit alcohol dehydrogenase family)